MRQLACVFWICLKGLGDLYFYVPRRIYLNKNLCNLKKEICTIKFCPRLGVPLTGLETKAQYWGPQGLTASLWEDWCLLTAPLPGHSLFSKIAVPWETGRWSHTPQAEAQPLCPQRWNPHWLPDHLPSQQGPQFPNNLSLNWFPCEWVPCLQASWPLGIFDCIPWYETV